MAATSARKAQGRWATRLISAGDGGLQRRSRDLTEGEGRGPASGGRIRCSRAAPRRDRGPPQAEAARSEAGMPTRSAVPVTEPADVPTMTEAWRGSHPTSPSMATPPAPRTRPMAGPGRSRKTNRVTCITPVYPLGKCFTHTPAGPGRRGREIYVW